MMSASSSSAAAAAAGTVAKYRNKISK